MNLSYGPNDPYTVESPDGYVMGRSNSLRGIFDARYDIANIIWETLEMTPELAKLRWVIETYVNEQKKIDKRLATWISQFGTIFESGRS